jgi:hypothetical protein
MKPTPEPQPAAAEIVEIELTMTADAVARFLPMLGEGFFLKGPGGRTVEDFLVKAAGIPAAYLKERVQTVFLDGRALDDFSTARVTDGATLALSAAMPGLAGAVLRRGGFYAHMRQQISHEAQTPTAAAGAVRVSLKLFNIIARELGPAFLQKGVLVPGARLGDFIQRQGRWVWKDCLTALIDGRPVKPDQIPERIMSRGWIRLSIHPPT